MKLQLWLVLGGALGAGTWGAGGLVRADERPVADVDFLAESITHSACEVRAGELALTGAKAKEVQQFARKVIDQQGKFDRALNRLAWDNKVPVQFNQVSGRQRADRRLAKLRGQAFDQELLQLLSEDLEQWIDLSQRCASGPGGRAERELATEMLPTLRQRLQEAKRLLKTVR
jgi:predicted outer membrane protein